MRCDNEDIRIIKKILSEEKLDGKEKINELRAQIYAELHKPDDEMDCDLIDENIRTLFLLEGGEYDDHVDAEAGLKKARKMAEERAKAAQPKLKRVMQNRFMKPVLAACLTLVFLFSANAIVAHATGNSLLDSVVKFGRNYISFDFTQSNGRTASGQETVSENDALYQELVKKCKEFDLSPLLPKSLPQDFKILNFGQQNFKIKKNLSIDLGNNSDLITINVDYYYDRNNISIVKAPETSDYDKLDIHGIDVYLMKKSDTYVSVFNDGNYVYNVNSSLPYDETEKVLKSFDY
ncbi:hypothetical protein CAFE_09680 [Caprobacter fermentans]|uniref:DUF4367 domain-containing protein n=1 Tax=Caproicibacter fermentans TaxID=2576756 RepID=A0A6N8HWV2_9FIRM|nr:DUF4367 domain-containing protein [Caproicibacter fermentans]MVB10286.1 hypothetical protein [Caproicibacter fermentans]